jgi:single-strand DNA-binding protein
MNKKLIIGTLGKDAEVKSIAGNNYTVFDVAVKDREETMWINCLKFDKEGKLAPYLHKGDKVFVEGTPRIKAYVNKQGTPIATETVMVDNLEFVYSKSRTEINEPSAPDDLPLNPFERR